MAFIVTWTPTEGLLFTEPETGGPVSEFFSADAETIGGVPVTVTSYGYSISPTPSASVFTFNVTPTGVAMSATTLAGLMPIDGIDYLLGGVLATAADWDDLPAEAEEIVAFRAGTTASITFTLTITAIAGGSDPISAEYTFTITRDWTAGRDRLIAEVALRS